MPTKTLRIATPVGELEFIAEAAVESNSQLSLNVAPFEPSLPKGMSVAGCYSALLRIKTPQIGTDIHLKAQLQSTASIEFGPETGEGLEAQAWYNMQSMLLIGTEDAIELKARLRERIVISNDTFEYSANSLSIRIQTALKTDALSFHLIVAWNSLPEPMDSSCWFAVDQKHCAVTAAFSEM